MKIKTSVTISAQVLKDIDKASPNHNRSVFFEEAATRYLNYMKRLKSEKKDLQIINENAEELNREAADVLNYQLNL